jgi:hypothetical protein
MKFIQLANFTWEDEA